MTPDLFCNYLKDRMSNNELPGVAAHELMMKHMNRPSIDLAPKNAKSSAVLIHLSYVDDFFYTYLIQRTIDKSVHSGQISFPGGKKDDSDIDLAHCAIREAKEELNLIVTVDEIIGSLTPLYIPPSNFLVYPFVSFSQRKQDIFPSENEVAHIIHLPIQRIFLDKIIKEISRNEIKFPVSAYSLDDERFVWGATAMILSELEMLWMDFMKSINNQT